MIKARPIMLEFLLWISTLLITVFQLFISYYDNNLSCKVRAWIGIPVHILYFSAILFIATRLLLLYHRNIYFDDSNFSEVKEEQLTRSDERNPRSFLWDKLIEIFTGRHVFYVIYVYTAFVIFWILIFAFMFVWLDNPNVIETCDLKKIIDYGIGGIIVTLLLSIIVKLYECYDEYWVKNELYLLIVSGSVSVLIPLLIQILVSDSYGQMLMAFTYILPPIIHFGIPIFITIYRENKIHGVSSDEQLIIEVIKNKKGLNSVKIFMAAYQYSGLNTYYTLWRDICIILNDPEHNTGKLYLLYGRFNWDSPNPERNRLSNDINSPDQHSSLDHIRLERDCSEIHRWYIDAQDKCEKSEVNDLKINHAVISELTEMLKNIEKWLMRFNSQYLNSSYYRDYSTLSSSLML